MSAVISYPGDRRPEPPRYSIWERRPPGPWQTTRVPAEMTSLHEAVRAAQARVQWEPGLLVVVVDQRGFGHWTNAEGDPFAVPPGGRVVFEEGN